jgi:hypothetical protein
MNNQQQHTAPLMKTQGKIHHFFVSLETPELILHSCTIGSGATNNIMSLSIMEVIGIECTKYYDVWEIIYAIDSINFHAYGEIRDLCA